MHLHISLTTLPMPTCGRCLFDAASQCGMAGAARCPLIAMSEAGTPPAEWSRGATGSWTCSEFEPDEVSLEH